MSEDIFWLPEPAGRKLAIVKRPQPKGASEAAQMWKAEGLGVIVSLLGAEEATALGLSDEAQACEAAGVEFVSYPVPDFDVPPSAAELSSLFESLARRLETGAGVGIHCRGSVGRSGMVASCFLTHLGVEGETAMQQVSEARGHKVPELPQQAEWVLSFASEAAKKRATSSE